MSTRSNAAPEAGPTPRAGLLAMATVRSDASDGDAEQVAVDAAATEIGVVADAIKGLQERLERADQQMQQVSAVRATEVEIGRLFVEAQRFTEASLTSLEQQVQDVLLAAQTRARQIIVEAQEEAVAIRRRAEADASIPTRTAEQLRAAISGFSHVNAELIQELGQLNQMLGEPSITAPSTPAEALPVD